MNGDLSPDLDFIAHYHPLNLSLPPCKCPQSRNRSLFEYSSLPLNSINNATSKSKSKSSRSECGSLAPPSKNLSLSRRWRVSSIIRYAIEADYLLYQA